MAYIRRVRDGRIFELFGTDHKDLPTLFLVYESEDNLGWMWRSCFDYEPLEELVPDDEEDDEDEGDDNALHLPVPPKEDAL